MKNNTSKKVLFGCAMALTAFDALSMMNETFTTAKEVSKFQNLGIYTKFIKSYLPKLETSIVKKLKEFKSLENNQAYMLIAPKDDLQLNLPKKNLLVSNYFKTFSKNEYNKDTVFYFDTEVSSETCKIIALYLKFYQTEEQSKIEQAILNSSSLLEIYRQADKLCIKPLLKFLNKNILDVLIGKGFINQIIFDVDEEKFYETLDAYLCGHLDEIIEECKTNPNYFEMQN